MYVSDQNAAIIYIDRHYCVCTEEGCFIHTYAKIEGGIMNKVS